MEEGKEKNTCDIVRKQLTLFCILHGTGSDVLLVVHKQNTQKS